ncbi:MAG TPA: DNA primase, partial [Clostridiales bacterium]|nr:DNA primase [Clostridiales bacterium]
QEFLITLKEKLNIVEVASGYITLERRGGSHWACCPFHHEKTPSFSINEADQYYHCFGCGESGDVIKFVREMENIDFMDAVKMLAERAGLQMPQTGFDNQKTAELKRKRDSLLKIMNDCAHFYLNNLNSGKAEEHVNYILKRRIPSNIVRTFGLGASLNFHDLPKYLLSRGYSRQDIIDSGAVNESDGRLTDAQAGRLIYPVINAMDEVVAFGGRVLKKTDFAKYKNTKETLIFNKSKTLYNINLLKKLRKTQTIREVIMVEGYMDTISLYQAGFKNVVASMGTSLTQEQARLIKRYTDTVLISYDGDGAGQKANMRGLEILKGEGINVKVVPLPDGLDPDDVIKQLGAEGYRKCLDNAMPLIDYKLSVLERGFDLSKPEDKRKFISEAIKIVRTADSAAEQEDLLKQLRDKTGITYESLSRDLNSLPKVQAEEKPKPVRRDTSNATAKASRFVIAAYLFGAKFADGDLSEIPFYSEVHTIISKYLISKRLLEERVQPAELFEFFDENTAEYEELCRILDYSDGDAFSGAVAEKYFKDCVVKLKLYDTDRQIAALTAEIEAEAATDKRKILAFRLQKLIKQKEKLKSGDK